MANTNDPRLNVVYYLPGGRFDSFLTNGEENTVADFFWQVYYEAADQQNKKKEEPLAVIIKLEQFPLGPFVLPFEQETPQMKTMSLAEFSALLWRDWAAAYRILPPNAFARIDQFLAAPPGPQ